MPRIERRTLGAFSRAVGSYCRTHAELDQYFFEYALEGHDPGGSISARAVGLARGIEDLDDQAVVDLLGRFLGDVGEGLRQTIPEILQLLTALEASGFLFEDDRLIPTTPGPAAIRRAVSKLELDLRSRGYEVAAEHYCQAVDNYVDGHHEASNGQIRSFVENLFIELGRRAGMSPSSAPSALQHLHQTGAIEEWEFRFCKEFWSGIQGNGPHQGLSHPEEAEFRLHTATSIGRYLLAQFSTDDA